MANIMEAMSTFFRSLSPEEQKSVDDEATRLKEVGGLSETQVVDEMAQRYLDPVMYAEARQQAVQKAKTSPEYALTALSGLAGGLSKAYGGGAAEGMAPAEKKLSELRQEPLTELEKRREAALEGEQLKMRKAQEERASEKAGREKEQYERAKSRAEKEDDPTSLESQVLRDVAGRFGFEVPDTTSATTIKELLSDMESAYQTEVNRADKILQRQMSAERMENLEAQREWQRGEREQAAATRASENLQKKVAKLGKDLEDPQSQWYAISNVEDLMGVNLDDIKGAEDIPDIPGVTLPVIGTRVTAHSRQARMIDDAFQSVFNALLKARSGAAVTQPELIRLKKEFAEGKFRTEPEKILALKRYKEAVRNVMDNIEKRYAPEVVEAYSGLKSSSIKPTSAVKTPQTETEKVVEKAKNEIVRTTADGRKVVFDAITKKALRWAD